MYTTSISNHRITINNPITEQMETTAFDTVTYTLKNGATEVSVETVGPYYSSDDAEVDRDALDPKSRLLFPIGEFDVHASDGVFIDGLYEITTEAVISVDDDTTQTLSFTQCIIIMDVCNMTEQQAFHYYAAKVLAECACTCNKLKEIWDAIFSNSSNTSDCGCS